LGVGVRPVPDYELVQLLGRGGFGEVWKASGPGGFAVAMKFIRLGDHAGAIELRSLELMKDIRHANLLGVFGAWQRADLLIVAMELADRSLLDRLQETTAQGLPGIPLAELLEYMRDAARGIDHLNGIGVQHRDIKPHNLLLVGGSVKVADFGLAKLLQHTVTSNTGAMTPAYAAPEFIQGQTSSHSDQYGLAVTYCKLRGGRLPFEGNHFQVMAGHATQPPDLTMLPKAERPAVARAMAKEPKERWPSCHAFVEALTSHAMRPLSPAGVQKKEKPLAPPPGRAQPPKEVTNSIGMKLRLIPAGKFAMGSPPDEPERESRDNGSETQHELEITQPSYLGAYLVTQAEYECVMHDNPSWFSAKSGGKEKVAGMETDRFPVDSISWEMAQKFCDTLSNLPAEKAAQRTYRLPTEAEWEYACREGGRSSTPFYFGDSLSSTQANFNGNQPYGGAAKGPCLERPTPVGSYQPNRLGLYDMHGNVWQWCQDWYDKDYPAAVRFPPIPGPWSCLRPGHSLTE
jgi:formylglycine-generating enzyme required for sulfatase activity